jgi:tRNA threonylcarbamoyladenosine biosynthesis protein TsaB
MPTRILAIETATPACSAALTIDDGVLERYALAPRQHATLMLPMLESLLLEAGLSVNQLDAVAFGRGPGSFTGVRIAAGIVQGIAYAADLPVVPVSTLAALALGGMREANCTHVIAAMDARKSEIYLGSYINTANDVAVLQGDERVCAPHAASLPGEGEWVGVGGGWDAYGEALIQLAGERVIRLIPDLEPRAADVARLALQAYESGVRVTPAEAVPVYLRNDVAVPKQSPGKSPQPS